jgi:hypothetical protein
MKEFNCFLLFILRRPAIFYPIFLGPLALAKQTLGHASIATTKKYFAGFDLAAQAEYTKALANF